MENSIFFGDCLDILRGMPSDSVDLFLQDPPYNLTKNHYECSLGFEALWKEWLRVGKKNANFVFTSQQPFTTDLINSNRKMFRYELIWDKKNTTGFLDAKRRPLRQHENILVFGTSKSVFNPIFHENKVKTHRAGKKIQKTHSSNYGAQKDYVSTIRADSPSYPRSIIEQTKVINNSHEKLPHPNQKPIFLFEWLVKSYSNEGDTIFDGYGGSGTTAIAAINTNRKYLIAEKDKQYFELIQKRLKEQ